jgi:hypothetical protein
VKQPEEGTERLSLISRLQEINRRLAEASRAGPLRNTMAQLSETLRTVNDTANLLKRRTGELTEAREALAVNRNRYRELFDFAPDGYLVTNLHGVWYASRTRSRRCCATRSCASNRRKKTCLSLQ